jgi:hypothetical protein
MTDSVIERVAERMHEDWRSKKLAAGVTSRPDAVSGEELMVPYPQLSEAGKELNRGPARVALVALRDSGYVVVAAQDQADVSTPSDTLAQSGEHIAQFFAYAHLPSHLQSVSRPFGALAALIVSTLPRNPERTVALRKLVEAKDAAVRALVAKPLGAG